MADEGGVDDVANGTELADRIRAGDADAEARLVLAYLPGVRASVRKHCRPNDPALDDLVQEVLLRVLMHLREGHIRDAVALPAYVRSLTANIAINEYRRRRQLDGHAGDNAIDAVPDPENPESAADRASVSGLIARLLGDLPVARDREILMRRYVQDQKSDEICAEMGLDEGLYRRVLHRARERLRGMAERLGLRDS